jgi:hypothetical protein
MNTYGTPSGKCPFCGNTLDAATDYTPLDKEEKRRPPKEGDLCVCMYCSEALEFKADGTLMQATITTLMELTQKQHKVISKTQEWVRGKRPKAKGQECKPEK